MGICSKLLSRSYFLIGLGIIALAIAPKTSFSQSEEDILNSIGSELDDESSKKKEADRIEKEYKVLKSKADAAYSKKMYGKAKDYYNQMAKLKPDSDYAVGRMTLMDQKLAQAKEAETQKKYQELIKQGDALLASEKWSEATSKYNAALALSPDESYPKSQIAKVTTLKTEAEAAAKAAIVQKKYDEVLSSAEKALTAKNWDVAKQKFKEASGIKPSESYPREKAAMIDKLKAEAIAKAKKIKLDKDYTTELVKADQLLSTKKYNEAIASYEVAKGLKPAESYPTQQITKAKDRIKIEADKKLKAEQLETDYQKQKKMGEDAISEKKWLVAIEAFSNAMALKPGNTDMTSLLNQAKSGKRAADELALKEKAEAEALVKTQKQFESEMAKGEAALTAKNWDQARTSFNSAKKLKPSETSPETQLTKLAQLIADEKAAQAEAEAKKIAEENAKKEKLAEEARLAAEKKAAEEAKLAEEQRTAEEAAQAAKAKRLADEAAEQARKEEEAKLAAEKKAAEEARIAKEAEVAAAEAAAAENKRLEEEAAEKQRLEEEAKIAAEAAALEKERLAKEAAVAASQAEAELLEKNRIAELKAKEEAERLAAEQAQLAKEQELAAALKAEEESAKLKAVAEEKSRIEQEAKLAAEKAVKEKERLAKEAAAAALLAAELKEKEAAQKKENDRMAAEKAKAEADQLALQEKLAQEAEREKEELLAAQNKKGFDEAVAQYKSAIKNSEWDLALRAVNSAETFMPDNSEVAKMQSELSSLQSAEKAALNAEKEKAAKALALDKEYESFVKSGDAALAKKDFEAAKSAYRSALGLKSKEDYPKNQLDVIKSRELEANAEALAAQQKLDKEFSEFMAAGEEAMRQKDWNLAKDKFNGALQVKPSNNGPKERLKAIEALLLKERELENAAAELEEDYSERMKNGQMSIDNEKYADAKRFYFGASKLKPTEELPKQKLQEVETLWAAQVEKEKVQAAAKQAEKRDANYNGFIMSGDQALQNKMWDEAISSYQGAINLKPEEAYPKQKLSEVKARKSEAMALADSERKKAEAAAIAIEKERMRLEAEEKAKEDLETNFSTAMAMGNSSMSDENYKNAVKGYREAVRLKPEHSEANSKLDAAKIKLSESEADRKAADAERKRLADIELAKRQEVARVQREAYLEELNKNSPTELAKKYPDGITEEVDTENELVVTKSIIVENNEGRYLIRFDYPWGEHFYYLDGKKIREDAYNWNIRKYKF